MENKGLPINSPSHDSTNNPLSVPNLNEYENLQQDIVEFETYDEYHNNEDDDTEEDEQGKQLELHLKMEFDTWEIAETHLNNYA